MIIRRVVSPICRSLSTYQHLLVTTPAPKVYNVQLNRPAKRNALSLDMWREIGSCFDELSDTSDCRAIVLSGNGKMFCAGIDLAAFMSIWPKQTDPAHKALAMLREIRWLQDSFTALERCRKPVIAAIHGGCIGGGIDLVSAADIRVMSAECYIQVKEVDIGIVADVGTTQRLPKIVGNQSWVSEICLTARKVYSDEAANQGIVSGVYPDREALMEHALALATRIAGKSPVAVQGTKSNLVYSREHSVAEGLERVGLWNSVMLQGEDPMRAMSGGDKAEFEDP